MDGTKEFTFVTFVLLCHAIVANATAAGVLRIPSAFLPIGYYLFCVLILFNYQSPNQCPFGIQGLPIER